jgi:ribosomal protein L10
MPFLKSYKNVFIIEVMNLTAESQTAIRLSLKGDFYFGKKTLLVKALESKGEKFAKLKEFLVGSTGDKKVCFFFTNLENEEV